MKFASFGRTALLYRTVEALTSAGHEATVLGTCRAAPESEVKESDLEELARRLDVPFFVAQQLTGPEAFPLLKGCGAPIAISVNWISIVGQRVCDLFAHGVLNGHAGDLPRYRGNAPWAYAILNAEKRLGVCVHQMEPGQLDSGAIYLKRFLSIQDDTTVGDLIAECEELLPDMFVTVLDGIEAGTLKPVSQSTRPSDSLRCYPRAPCDALIDWSMSATHIERLVRASTHPFSGAYTFHNGRKLVVWRASRCAELPPCVGKPGQVILRNGDSGAVDVLTGDGALRLVEVGFDGSRNVRPAEILKSLRDRLGLAVEDEVVSLRTRVARLESALAHLGDRLMAGEVAIDRCEDRQTDTGNEEEG